MVLSPLSPFPSLGIQKSPSNAFQSKLILLLEFLLAKVAHKLSFVPANTWLLGILFQLTVRILDLGAGMVC